jgi:hypothetical protein
MLVLFAAASVVYLYQNNYAAPSAVEGVPTQERISLFDEVDGQVVALKVESADGKTASMERGGDGLWRMISPAGAEADQVAIDSAARQAAGLQSIGEVTGSPADFGLDQPAFTIRIDFDTGVKHSLEIGDATPTNRGYYVRLDGGGIVMVPRTDLVSLTDLAEFPPILLSPTPTNIPETPTAIPANTQTPQAGETVTPAP